MITQLPGAVFSVGKRHHQSTDKFKNFKITSEAGAEIYHRKNRESRKFCGQYGLNRKTAFHTKTGWQGSPSVDELMPGTKWKSFSGNVSSLSLPWDLLLRFKWELNCKRNQNADEDACGLFYQAFYKSNKISSSQAQEYYCKIQINFELSLLAKFKFLKRVNSLATRTLHVPCINF